MFPKYCLLYCILIALIPSQIFSQDVSVEQLMTYNKWRLTNKRIYLNDDEQVYRQQIFFENLKKISDFNKNNNSTYELGLNQFSDTTDEEFRQKMLSDRVGQNLQEVNKEFEHLQAKPRGAGYGAPQSVDWRTKGVLTPIKHQGWCNNFYAFTSVGIMESYNAIKTGRVTAFSEQQLTDCINLKGDTYFYGCSGGYPQHALQYTQKFGILTAAQYPYQGFPNECKAKGYVNGFYPRDYYQIEKNNVEALKAAVAQGPVSVLVDASNWKYFFGGVFTGCPTPNEYKLNHGVVLVGYDTNGNWIIRNSWSTGWGEKGYMKVGAGNTCGILLSAWAITP